MRKLGRFHRREEARAAATGGGEKARGKLSWVERKIVVTEDRPFSLDVKSVS